MYFICYVPRNLKTGNHALFSGSVWPCTFSSVVSRSLRRKLSTHSQKQRSTRVLYRRRLQPTRHGILKHEGVAFFGLLKKPSHSGSILDKVYWGHPANGTLSMQVYSAELGDSKFPCSTTRKLCREIMRSKTPYRVQEIILDGRSRSRTSRR